jgi:hypothetical protein
MGAWRFCEAMAFSASTCWQCCVEALACLRPEAFIGLGFSEPGGGIGAFTGPKLSKPGGGRKAIPSGCVTGSKPGGGSMVKPGGCVANSSLVPALARVDGRACFGWAGQLGATGRLGATRQLRPTGLLVVVGLLPATIGALWTCKFCSDTRSVLHIDAGFVLRAAGPACQATGRWAASARWLGVLLVVACRTTPKKNFTNKLHNCKKLVITTHIAELIVGAECGGPEAVRGDGVSSSLVTEASLSLLPTEVDSSSSEQARIGFCSLIIVPNGLPNRSPCGLVRVRSGLELSSPSFFFGGE